MLSHCRLAVHWNFGRLQRTADRKFDAWLMSPVGDCHRSSNLRNVPATAPAPPDHPLDAGVKAPTIPGKLQASLKPPTCGAFLAARHYFRALAAVVQSRRQLASLRS